MIPLPFALSPHPRGPDWRLFRWVHARYARTYPDAMDVPTEVAEAYALTQRHLDQVAEAAREVIAELDHDTLGAGASARVLKLEGLLNRMPD